MRDALNTQSTHDSWRADGRVFAPYAVNPDMAAGYIPNYEDVQQYILKVEDQQWKSKVNADYGTLGRQVEAQWMQQRLAAQTARNNAVASVDPRTSMAFNAFDDALCQAPADVVKSNNRSAARSARLFNAALQNNPHQYDPVIPDVPDRPNYFANGVKQIWKNVGQTPSQNRSAAAAFSILPTVIMGGGAVVEWGVNGLLGINDRVRQGMQSLGAYVGTGDSKYLWGGVKSIGLAGVETYGVVSPFGLGERVGAVGGAFPQRSVVFGPSAKSLDILTADQLALHERLSVASFQGTRSVEAPWGTLSFDDVSALSKATGWEHAVVRLNDGTRMLVRGASDNVSDVLKLDVNRLIVHSHPGDTLYHLAPSGELGDVGYLWQLGQNRSYIVTTGTRTPGTDFWLGTFNNEGYWRALNNPPMMPAGGNVFR